MTNGNSRNKSRRPCLADFKRQLDERKDYQSMFCYPLAKELRNELETQLMRHQISQVEKTDVDVLNLATCFCILALNKASTPSRT